MEIWEPKPPGTLWATRGLLQDCCTFTFLLFYSAVCCNPHSMYLNCVLFFPYEVLCYILSLSAVRRWLETSFQHSCLPPHQNSSGKVLHKHWKSCTVFYVLWETKQNTVNYLFLWKKVQFLRALEKAIWKKLNKNETAGVVRRPVQLRAVHSTKHVSLKDCLLLEFSISICFSVDWRETTALRLKRSCYSSLMAKAVG